VGATRRSLPVAVLIRCLNLVWLDLGKQKKQKGQKKQKLFAFFALFAFFCFRWFYFNDLIAVKRATLQVSR
jgi:hypothetical protein